MSSSATAVEEKAPRPPQPQPPAAAKRSASASSSGADGDEAQRELKRTRPIKACQACRAKKVKCILKPDEPVCEQCAASGKTCLFRVDDLCPTLRRERFAAYGPPGKNARTIAGKKGGKKGRPDSSGADEPEDADDAQARQRRKTDAEDSRLAANGKPAKAKAVFRSFANPTNLAAPSAGPLKREEPQQQVHPAYEPPFVHPAERPSPVQQHAHTLPMGHYRSASQHSQGSAHSMQRPPLPHTSSGSSSGAMYSPSEPPQMLPSFRLAFSGASGSHAPHAGYSDARGEAPRRTSFFAASPPASSLRSTGVEARDFAASPPGVHHDGAGGQAFSPVSRWYAHPERQPGEAFPEFASPSPGKWQRAPSFSSNIGAPSPGTWAMSTFIAGATPGHEPPRSDVDEHRAAPARPAERFGAPPGSADSTSAVVRAPLREMPPPERPGSSGMRVPGRPIGAADDARPTFIVDTPQEDDEEIDGDALRRQRAPGVKKIALPFFRWFGATANTPGIRRIKVGVYHEADLDLQEESAAATPAAGLPAPATAAASPPDAERGGPRSVETLFNTPRDNAPGMSVSPQATGASQAGAASSSHRPREWGRAGGAESTVSASTRELFEPDRPRYPRRALLQELVPLFLRYFRCSFFPWLDSEELLALVHSSEMPALLANAICAVTARFSTRPELIARGAAKSCGEPFAEMAKILLVPMLSWPSIDVIEALVILSYSEFGAGADAGLWMYVGMALRMSVDLGLQHEATVASMANARQQERARWLFWSVICLDRITTFGTGRPVTMREDEFDLVLPPLTEDAQSNLFVAGHIVRCLLRRGRIGDLLNRADDIAPQERGKRLHALWTDLVEYYDSLPQPLHFSVSTFQRAMTADQGPAFIYLHVLLQSTMSLINRPQLLRRFESSFVAAPTKLASIAAHASSTIVSILRFAEDARHDRADRLEDGSRRDFNQFLDTSPYLDQLILPCGRAFLAERQDVRDALRRLGYTPASASRPQSREGVDAAWGPLHSSRQYAEANLASCQLVLNRLATYWGGAAWPARALEQESAGATEDVDPDARDEDAQPAPVRDLEMVLRWARARARVKRARAATQTPGQSRRGSVAGGAEPDAGDAHAPALLAGGGDTNSDGPSPLGLGFSGTFGSDIDVEALISAWASENTGGGIGLGQAQALAPHWQQQQQGAAALAPPGALPNFAFNVAGGSPFDLGAMQLEELFSDEVFPVDLLEGDGDAAPPALLNAFFPRVSGPPPGLPPHAQAAQHHALHPAYPPP